MKLMIIGPRETEHYGIVQSFISIGCDVKFFIWHEFYQNSSYLERKLYKFGVIKLKKIFDKKELENLKYAIDEFKPEKILLLNGMQFTDEALEYLSRFNPYLWTWDSIYRFPKLEKAIQCAKEIFCFEHKDVKFIREKYNKKAEYLPLGANGRVFFSPNEALDKEIDICFVGSPYPHRKMILEKIAKWACENNKKMKIGGKFYDDRYIWKKYIFKKRYPMIFKCLDNRFYSTEELADLYRKSKISININAENHHSLNPRFFETAATMAMTIMDDAIEDYGDFVPDDDMVIYRSDDQLIDFIDYYLKNEKERTRIVQNAYNKTVRTYCIKSQCEKILMNM